jgi:hypothetical protein
VPSGGPPSDIFGRRHDGPVLVEPQDTLALEREGYEPGPWSEDFGGKLYGAGMSLSYGQPLRPWRKPHDPTGKTFFEGGQPKLTVCFDGIEFCSGELRVLGPDAKVTQRPPDRASTPSKRTRSCRTRRRSRSASSRRC